MHCPHSAPCIQAKGSCVCCAMWAVLLVFAQHGVVCTHACSQVALGAGVPLTMEVGYPPNRQWCNQQLCLHDLYVSQDFHVDKRHMPILGNALITLPTDQWHGCSFAAATCIMHAQTNSHGHAPIAAQAACHRTHSHMHTVLWQHALCLYDPILPHPYTCTHAESHSGRPMLRVS